ncbi:hypothetical protein [Candidatus Oscillochloris fontis]|uniref:hypothetical protein n=1 Tax=Candidatus Oscillochloris fontis TaxID=2496868 RepID=UPI00101CFB25|nr:hypothetical protein [Candidatus Oscillochloris fontis]
MTIQFPGDEIQPNIRLRRNNTTAVRSHESYVAPAHRICHHSGQYLTIEETNPDRIALLREQHDFPGFKTLDDRFKSAAHVREFQHFIWSKPLVQAIGLLGAVFLLCGGIFLIWPRMNQWSGYIEGGIVYLSLATAIFGAVFMLSVAFWKIIERNTIYHREAKGQRPAINDFPLFGAYQIDIEEHYKLDLANSTPTPTPGTFAGTVTVQVLPEEDALSTYRTYCDTYASYRGAGVGDYLFAGVVALEGRKYLTFNPPIDYDYRILLRQPIDTSFVVQGKPTRTMLRFDAPYQINPTVLQTDTDLRCMRNKLECTPQISNFDSYTLHLTFKLEDVQVPCLLNECRLLIPVELGKVLHVEFGRYSQNGSNIEVMWHNLMLKNGSIRLSVRFSEPLLGKNAPPFLQGSYQITVAAALSGIQVPLDHVWDPMGLMALPRTRPSVKAKSVIQGTLTANIAVLAQEHEHVSAKRIDTAAAPTGDLLEKLIQVLTEIGVDIQRIEEAMPRREPLSSTLNHQLRYWDVVGRKYEHVSLEAVDIHIVISGSTYNLNQPQISTNIDIRARCLYDPRSPQIVNDTNNTCELIVDRLNNMLPPAN